MYFLSLCSGSDGGSVSGGSVVTASSPNPGSSGMGVLEFDNSLPDVMKGGSIFSSSFPSSADSFSPTSAVVSSPGPAADPFMQPSPFASNERLPTSPGCTSAATSTGTSSVHGSASSAASSKRKAPKSTTKNSRKRKGGTVKREASANTNSDLEDADLAHLSKKERNRISAARYRKRRKNYVGQLEEKASALENTVSAHATTISALQTENGVLREQVAFLKKLLGQAAGPDAGLSVSTGAKRAGVVMFVLFTCFLFTAPGAHEPDKVRVAGGRQILCQKPPSNVAFTTYLQTPASFQPVPETVPTETSPSSLASARENATSASPPPPISAGAA